MIALFVPEDNYVLRGFILFAMYALGIIVAALVAFILKSTVLRGPTPPFVMELPAYKFPSIRLVAHRMLTQGFGFIRRAGTIILAVSVIVWAAFYFPRDRSTVEGPFQAGAPATLPFWRYDEDAGMWLEIGTLTLSFANVAAYETFDRAKPFDSRLITHNLNRIWSPAWLDGGEDSVELRRAREMRPAVAAADHILDIHSTSQDVVPFWVYPAFERNAAVARALPQPAVHLVMPAGLGSGTPLIQHGAHGRPDGEGAALVVECGQHFCERGHQV